MIFFASRSFLSFLEKLFKGLAFQSLSSSDQSSNKKIQELPKTSQEITKGCAHSDLLIVNHS